MSDAAAGADGLTITDAARAFGTGRRILRSMLAAGDFPNAGKDAQGFWRIPESDLLAAGLRLGDEEAVAVTVVSPPAGAPTESEELQLLRIEVLELRHRVERAESLLEAERRLSDERAKALEAERVTVEALYRQTGLAPPTPRAPDPPKIDWQASMRAARERDLQQRAARDAELRQRPTRPAPTAPIAPTAPVEPAAMATDQITNKDTLTAAPDETPAGSDAERRHRWRRR